MNCQNDFAFAKAEGDALFDEEGLDVVLGEGAASDDLAEPIGDSVEGVVPLALAGVAEAVEFTIDGCSGPGGGVPGCPPLGCRLEGRGLEGLENPGR